MIKHRYASLVIFFPREKYKAILLPIGSADFSKAKLPGETQVTIPTWVC